jgi:uncharacterized protein
MKTKGIGSEILDVSGRTIVAYVSKFGNIDLDGDMMMQGCYKASINARGKGGTNELFHLSNHRPSPEFVLSKPSFEEDSFGLKMTSTIVDTNHGNDIVKLYESGLISQHSVMFSVPKGKWETKELEDGTNYTTIYEAKLYEGSTVVWGANPETPTLEMKSLYKDMYNNDIQGALDHFGKITKALKKGTFTDEMFALIEIQYKMLESFIIEEIETIKNTLPTNVVEPLEVEKSKNEQLINFLKDLKNNL